MKKRLLSLLLTAVMAASIVGCGSSTTTSTEETDSQETQATETDATQETVAEETSSEPKILKTAASFAYLADFEMTAVDDKTFTVDTKAVYPTLKNDLANPEFGIIDLNDPRGRGFRFILGK